jgi:hypothetical protein
LPIRTAGLAEFARQRNTSTRASTLVTNVVLDGAGDRASGRVYVLEISGAGADGAGMLSTGGLFLDEYVKTSRGWRFASREFVRARLPAKP